MGSAGVTLPQHGHGEVAFSRVRRCVQDFVWLYKILQNKVYRIILIFSFKHGRAGVTDLEHSTRLAYYIGL